MLVSLTIASFVLLISIIVCVSRFNRLEPDWLRLFAFFLPVEFTVQIGGYFYSHITHKSNQGIFNFLVILEFIFYLFILYKSIDRRELKLFAKWLDILFLLFAAGNLFFGEGFSVLNEHTYTAGTLLVILCAILYFASIFTAEYVVNFFSLPMFWIATGLFFHYAGNGVYLSLLSYIERNNIDPQGRMYMIISVVLNVLLYSLFIIGFLCGGKWRKENKLL